MKAKMILVLLAFVSAPAFAANPVAVAGYSIGTADAVILGTAATLLVATIIFRAQVRKYARLQEKG